MISTKIKLLFSILSLFSLFLYNILSVVSFISHQNCVYIFLCGHSSLIKCPKFTIEEDPDYFQGSLRLVSKILFRFYMQYYIVLQGQEVCYCSSEYWLHFKTEIAYPQEPQAHIFCHTSFASETTSIDITIVGN